MTLKSTSCMPVANPPYQAVGSISSGPDPQKEQNPAAAAVMMEIKQPKLMETEEKEGDEDDDGQGDGNESEA